MENRGTCEDIRNLREWAPLTELLGKIPKKMQKGIFFQDVSVTCVDALPEFIALGTNVGVVFWFNRASGNIQKLRCEQSKSITCLKIISSVEYLVAAGIENGQVNIFQIQKEHPPDLNFIAPITQVRPIERYTVKDLNRDAITALEWSKNGMKLFSGDRQGLVVLTEFDFVAHISKSIEILNEAYAIVQIVFLHPWLLVSSTYRTIICIRDDVSNILSSDKGNSWQITQVGKKDRKVLSRFGAVFTGTSRTPAILCSRPGFRFWLADIEGNVSHTFLLKDAVHHPSYELPILNPGPLASVLNGTKSSNFGPCYRYNHSYILTHNEDTIFIINLEELKIEATVRRIRKIQNLAINGVEIFVVECGGTLIRISTTPDRFNDSRFGSVVYNSNYISEEPIVFETEDDVITSADECFELPPIEQIHLETPLQTNSSTSKRDLLLLEHSRRVEIYEKISEQDYDDSILFKTASQKGKKKKLKTNGIVEVGQQAIPQEKPASHLHIINEPSSSHTFVVGAESILEFRLNDEPEPKLEPETSVLINDISTSTSTTNETNKLDCLNVSVTSACMTNTSFCNSFGMSPFLTSQNGQVTDMQPCLDKKLVTVKDLDDLKHWPVQPNDKYKVNMPQFNINDSDLAPLPVPETIHFLDRLGGRTDNIRPDMLSISAINVKKMPDYLHIPNLWYARIEKDDHNATPPAKNGDDLNGSGSGSSDWEFL